MSYPGRPAASSLAAFAYVALLGLAGFVLSTFSLLLTTPEGNALNAPVSYYYVHGHHGWLLTLGLLALGCSALALSIAVAQCVTGRTGPRGLALFGIAVIVAGLFPADPWWPWEQSPSLNASIHGMAAMVGMAVFAGTAIPLMRALRSEARWDRVAPFFYVVAAAGVLGLVGSFVSLGLRLPPQFLGLTERLAIGAGVAWLALIALGLLHSPTVSSRPPVK
jgi:hypothetical protein